MSLLLLLTSGSSSTTTTSPGPPAPAPIVVANMVLMPSQLPGYGRGVLTPPRQPKKNSTFHGDDS